MYKEREVRVGMNYLDQAMPGWRRRIDLDSLDLTRNDRCIIGQLLGSFTYGSMSLRLDNTDIERFGFVLHHGHDKVEYSWLTNTWKTLIEATRAEHADDERLDRERRLDRIMGATQRSWYSYHGADLGMHALYTPRHGVVGSAISTIVVDEAAEAEWEANLARTTAAIAELMQTPMVTFGVSESMPMNEVRDAAGIPVEESERELVLV